MYKHWYERIFSIKNDSAKCEKVLTIFALKIKIGKKSLNSAKYWENRYKEGGNSGAGSYNNLAEFKAEVINQFVNENNINSVIEFGCGDGNQLKLLNFNKYIGYDVSPTILENTRKNFADKPDYSFDLVSNFDGKTADLAMSLDVIFHLVEDSVYENYMKNLFNASNRYVIIYSSNKNQEQFRHVRHRKFTDYVEKNFPEFKLINTIKNKYPYDEKNPEYTSFADFYIYQKL